MFAVTRVELVPGPKLRIGFMSPIGGDQIQIDASVGMVGLAGSDNVLAPAVAASEDGDLILVFFATDFGGIAPNPQLPYNMTEIVNQKTRPDAYWILGSYQSKRGETEEVESPTGQLFNSAAAQVAIKRR
jgi:hypothetical protein